MTNFRTAKYLPDGTAIDDPSKVVDITSMQATAVAALVSGDSYTVAVFGATPAGVAAAVAAARLNKRVLLISDSDRIGGMTGWGINHQDFAVLSTPALVPGMAREFYEKVGRQETINAKNFQRFHRTSGDGKPSWFIRAFEEIVAAERNISILTGYDLVSASKTGATINSITLARGDSQMTITAGVFIDASYTGDLAAASGCTVIIGREANATYGETLNGNKTPVAMTGTPSAYVTAGVPGSGLLPYVDGDAIPSSGTASPYIMSFTYRLFVTTNAGDRIPFPAPDVLPVVGDQRFEILARQMNAASTSFDTMAEVFNMYSAGRESGYYDLNSRPGISSNYPNYLETLEYVTATPARRAEIRENAKQYLLSLLYWIRYSGDARIPAALVSEIATYGLCASELQAYGGFSPEFYVREGRRIVGDFVMAEPAITFPNAITDTVAYCYYDLDSHMVRLVNDAGTVKAEGTQLTALTTSQLGAPIAYRVLLPKTTEVTNLLCPGCPSVSRTVWTTTRLEPVLMCLGQAAGIAASLAIDDDTTVQAIQTARLLRIQDITRVWDGIVVSTDGTYAEGTLSSTGTWTAPATTSRRFGYLGGSSLTNAGSGSGAATYKCAPFLQESGPYEIFVAYSPTAAADPVVRATAVRYTISHADGTSTRVLNQRYAGGKGGGWESLGIFQMRAENPAGTAVGGAVASVDYVEVDNSLSTDPVNVSGFKFVRR